MTYRRLMLAVEASQRSAWNHTAMICATIANVNRKPGSAAIDPRVFHPLEKEAAAGGGNAIDVDAETVGAIGRMFKKLKEGY